MHYEPHNQWCSTSLVTHVGWMLPSPILGTEQILIFKFIARYSLHVCSVAIIPKFNWIESPRTVFGNAVLQYIYKIQYAIEGNKTACYIPVLVPKITAWTDSPSRTYSVLSVSYDNLFHKQLSSTNLKPRTNVHFLGNWFTVQTRSNMLPKLEVLAQQL